MLVNKAANTDFNQSKAYLYFWTGQFLYIGKAADTSIHDHHAIQIVISLEQPIEISLPDSSFHSKAVIIDSDQPHECRTFGNQFLLLNIVPETKIGYALKRKYLSGKRIAELPDEFAGPYRENIKSRLTDEQGVDEIFSITRKFIYSLSGLEQLVNLDARVLQVIELLNQQRDSAVKIDDLAKKVFISPGRLIHLFTDQVGIPIRKYILWTKLLNAFRETVNSKNITRAALHGGFSDAPHFNRTFKRMFGLNPSALLKNSQIIQAYSKFPE